MATLPQARGRERVIIRPQYGPQEVFLSTPADIAIYGGSAGGGKTWSLLLEAIRHKENSQYTGAIFRRTHAQIRNPGGLWDQSRKLYTETRARANNSELLWRFPAGGVLIFGHLQHEGTEYDWQGTELAFLGFDELTHFSENQFFYLISRNRSLAGIRPYVRATTNPDADSWVAQFIEWWIGEDGYAIPERAGVIRWMLRVNGVIHWADTPDELIEEHKRDDPKVPPPMPKSVTFIPASVFDNKILLESNPEYLGNLQAQTLVEQERLLAGNWKIRVEAGKVFNRDWFLVVDLAEVPKDGWECRFFDFAATEKKVAGDDPDFTATVKIRKVNGRYYLMHAAQERLPPAKLEEWMRRFVIDDLQKIRNTPIRYMLRWETEPGSASRRENYALVRAFDGIDAAGIEPDGDKITRARALAAQAYAGNVDVVKAAWNNELLTHLHNQPDWPHDDLMDASTGSYNALKGISPEGLATLGKAFGVR